MLVVTPALGAISVPPPHRVTLRDTISSVASNPHLLLELHFSSFLFHQARAEACQLSPVPWSS